MMTINTFENRILKATRQETSGKTINELTEKQRMIYAIADCLVILNEKEFKDYNELEIMLDEIDGNEPHPSSRIEIIESSASVWKVDKSKLIANLKKLFI